jgi:guanylate kinase
MQSGSSTTGETKKFIGAYVSPAVKREVKRRAERRGETISEVVRRRLSAGENEEGSGASGT